MVNVEASEEEDEANIEIPKDFLLNERINARMFQTKLKRQGVALSMWEVFTLFEDLNGRLAKLFYEPQRYHHILYEYFHSLVTGEDYRSSVEEAVAEVKAEENH